MIPSEICNTEDHCNKKDQMRPRARVTAGAAGVAHTASIPGVAGRGGQGLAGTQDRLAVEALPTGRRLMMRSAKSTATEASSA